MSNMVYMVSSGSYSDYGIVACFSSVQWRDKYLAKYLEVDTEAFKEEFYLDPPMPVVIEVTRVSMSKNGSALTSACAYLNNTEDLIGFRYYIHHGENREVMYFLARTNDAKRAVKIVNEKRAQVIALGAWGNDELTREILGGK